MLNIGPRGDCTVPERAVKTLEQAGEWIRRYPQVVYGTQASPWQHAFPWGDVTRRGNTLFLCVFEWPASGKLYLPNLKTGLASAELLGGEHSVPIVTGKQGDWTTLELPPGAPEKLVSVIELKLAGEPNVDPVWSLDPNMETEILAEFAEVNGIEKTEKRWMEKFGEWKGVVHAHGFNSDGKASWEVDVLQPGDYNVDLAYAGEGRLVWAVAIEGGQQIQNQQNSSHNYQSFPIGWLNFPKAGRYKVNVSCLEGNVESASLKSIRFTPAY